MGITADIEDIKKKIEAEAKLEKERMQKEIQNPCKKEQIKQRIDSQSNKS